MRQVCGGVRERGDDIIAQGPMTAQSAQDIKAHDVPRSFPDGVKGSFTVKPRQHTFLNIAIATEALQRLVDQRWRRLAHPVFGGRDEQARVCGLEWVAGRAVDGTT